MATALRAFAASMPMNASPCFFIAVLLTTGRSIPAAPSRPGSSAPLRQRTCGLTLHLATDADTGRIVAAALTGHEADDGSQVGPLLDQVDGPVASFTADGAFDRDDVYGEVTARHPHATIIVPPRSGAVPSDTAAAAPTQRDRHIEAIAEHGRVGWQKASGYNWRALVEMVCSQTINSA